MKVWQSIIILLVLTAGCSGPKLDIAFSNDLISIDGTINKITDKTDDASPQAVVYASIVITNQDSVAVVIDLRKLELSIDSLTSTAIFYDRPDSTIDKLIYIKVGKKYIADVYWVFDAIIDRENIHTVAFKMD